jgi:hypothetical protein
VALASYANHDDKNAKTNHSVSEQDGAADDIDRLRSPVTGRDVVEAFASSPLAEMPFDRLSVKSKVRDIEL